MVDREGLQRNIGFRTTRARGQECQAQCDSTPDADCLAHCLSPLCLTRRIGAFEDPAYRAVHLHLSLAG
jgi:hypothetical protein